MRASCPQLLFALHRLPAYWPNLNLDFDWYRPVAAAGLRSEVVWVSVAARAAAPVVAFLCVGGVGVFVAVYSVGAATTQLPIVHYTASSGQVNVVLQEDAQNDSATRPDWATYYTQDPSRTKWLHTTLFSVPANKKVNVTIYGYDGCTPLRNNYFSQVQGTLGGTVTVSQFDQHGKEYATNKTTSLINSWSDFN